MSRSKLLLVMLLILMPMAFGMERYYYFENSTNVGDFTIASSSYNFSDTILDTTRPTNYSIQSTGDAVLDTNLQDYVFTGTGFAYSTNDTRCTFTECFVLTGIGGGGPTDEITTVEKQTFTDTSTGEWQYKLTYTNIGLEAGDGFEIWLYDGTAYRQVYIEDGSPFYLVNNNTWVNEISTFTFQLNSTFKTPSFKWFLRTNMNTDVAGQDGIYVHAVELINNNSVTSSYPSFYYRHVDNADELFYSGNLSLFYDFDMDANLTVGLNIYQNATGTSFGFNKTLQYNTTNTFVNISMFEMNLQMEQDDIVTFYSEVQHPGNFNGTFQFGAEQYPSHAQTLSVAGSINITSFNVNNDTFPIPLNATVQSSAPVDTITLQRDGVDIGNMFLCTPTTYCFTDATASSENGTITYQVTASNTDGFTKVQNYSIQINPVRQSIISANFNDIFYADVNETVPYYLYLSDTRGNIIRDAVPNITFITLGDTFNLTYNPSTERYETFLQFANEGEYPFAVNIGPNYYMFEGGNLSGNTIVRNGYQACFEGYTSVNVTDPYVNNLATLYAVDPADQNILLKDLGFMEMWTEGGLGTFNVNVFHAPYIDGQACLTLYNTTAAYNFYLVDGIISFKDNYDAPNVTQYGGLYINIGQFAPTPNTTTKFQITRAEYKYGKMLHNFLPMAILAIILAMAAFVALETGSIAMGFGVFVALFMLFLLFEIWVYVFG